MEHDQTDKLEAVDELGAAYDVVVVGGGAAGLSAALMLARSRRSVAVIDAGQPRNAPAHAIHGLLGREGMAPSEFLQRGRREVWEYGAHVVPGEVSASSGTEADGFTVTLTDGRTTSARRLLITTGLVDKLPDIPGLADRWGKDVLHCPYCHGFEVRDQRIGILATGPMAAHQAQMFRQLSHDVTVFAHTAMPDPEQLESLTARGIALVSGEVIGTEVSDDRLTGVRLADGSVVAIDALVIGPQVVARAGFLRELGLVTEEHPSGMGEFVPTEDFGRTTIPGVWAAGSVTDISAQVGAAAAGAALTGARINMDLITEEISRAHLAMSSA